jgi:transketolase
MEQSQISVAAGMALEGFIPFVHSITTFLVERAYEQIKDDFCYQQLEGNFISNGASYDYGTDGMTHYGPADVPILLQLPGMQIVVPGTASEFDRLLRAGFGNGSPTYYRTTLENNPLDFAVRLGQLEVVRQGARATVIAVGPALTYTLPAIEGMDVNLLYCTTVAPFDAQTLRAMHQGSELVVIEPYYAGSLVPTLAAIFRDRPQRIEAIGVPRQVLSRYGTAQQHDEAVGLSPQAIRQRIEEFLALS